MKLKKDEKFCPICKEVKKLDEFYRMRGQGRKGRQGYFKFCQKNRRDEAQKRGTFGEFKTKQDFFRFVGDKADCHPVSVSNVYRLYRKGELPTTYFQKSLMNTFRYYASSQDKYETAKYMKGLSFVRIKLNNKDKDLRKVPNDQLEYILNRFGFQESKFLNTVSGIFTRNKSYLGVKKLLCLDIQKVLDNTRELDMYFYDRMDELAEGYEKRLSEDVFKNHLKLIIEFFDTGGMFKGRVITKEIQNAALRVRNTEALLRKFNNGLTVGDGLQKLNELIEFKHLY